MIKRILVGLSGTRFTKIAVRQAIELAARHDATVTGVTIIDPKRLSRVGSVPLGGAAAAAELIEHRLEVTVEHVEEAVALFEKACREADVVGCVDREEGDMIERLEALWRYHDLVIFGLRGLFEYGVVHNPKDELARLLTGGISPIVAVSDEHREIRRVLIAYSGSTMSAKAMKRFAQLRPWTDVDVKVVAAGFKPEEGELLLTEAGAYLEAHGFHDVELEVIPGHPREALLAHVEEWGADLIVMGAAARNRIIKLILGNTALSVLLNANRPLFLAS